MVWIWPMMKVDQAAGTASTLQHNQFVTKTMFTDNLPHVRPSNQWNDLHLHNGRPCRNYIIAKAQNDF